ncbi:MAG: ABC transporter permease subunit [Verrucomicrobia bacterium]|nr:ABC transporter permease subunit [Verrucomicrobiota bacterium]
MPEQRVRWRQIKHHWEIYLMIIPTLLAVGLFVYYPATSGIFHSFFRWNGADIAEPLGMGNYKDLLFSDAFWLSFKNVFILGVWNAIKMVPPLFVAVAIHRCKSDRLQYFYRTLFVIPMVIPPLVVALIWRQFFFEATSGYLNQFIAALNLEPFLAGLAHLHWPWSDTMWLPWGDTFGPPPWDAVARAAYEAAPHSPPAWLGSGKLIMTACIAWGFPWVGSLAVLTHLAKLGSISKDVYEAGDIDGVGWWSKFTRIELPLITGSIYIMIVFTIIGTITDAGMILALAGMQGGPGGLVDVPALFMIRKAFIDQRMGYACAVGIILMLIVMSLQKISALVNEWRDYDVDERRRVRRNLLIIGIALNLIAPAMNIWGQTTGPLVAAIMNNPGTWLTTWLRGFSFAPYDAYFPTLLRNVSWLFLLFSIPFPALRMQAARRLKPTSPDSPVGPSRGDAREARVLARNQMPAYRAAARAGSSLLVFLRHGYVWSVLAFAFLPLYLMVIVSFKTNKQFYQAPAMLTHPLHPENWPEAWQMITPTLANSVFLSVGSTALMLLIALMGAYFFARQRMPMSSFIWNAILILMMYPMIANLVPLFRLLRDMSLLNTLTALILVGAAQGQIFAIFMLRSFIADIPKDLYEAAEIDGAGHFRQMWLIVLPLSGPILGTVGVMHFMSAWNEFVLPLIVMRDHARLPVMVQLLRISGEYVKIWGPLMAGYAMAAVPIVILFIASMKLYIRGMTEGAVKG